MAYMSVQKHSDTQLSLLREPTFLSKAVFVGFFIGVLAIFFYGSESCFFKVLIGLGATCLSFLIVDKYEICEFDKATSELKLTRLHWCAYLLGGFRCLGFSPDAFTIKAKLSDIENVCIEEQEGNSTVKAYHVVLCLSEGVRLGVTEVFTTDALSDHQAIANLICSFIGHLPPVNLNEADVEDDETCNSVDDFEQISWAELEEEKEALETAESSAPCDDKETCESSVPADS